VLNIAIEVGRGLAALWVFIFHLKGPIATAIPALGGFAAAGHFGVPVFFVISGYCMMAVARKTIQRGEGSGPFLFWRFLRIYPAFWLSMVVAVLIPLALGVLGLLKSGVFEVPPARWMALSAADWVRYFTLLQVFEARTVGMDYAFSAINIVYWTLAIEFQFYLVIWLGLLLRRHFDRLMIAVTGLGIVAAAFPAAYQTGIFLPYWPMFALGLALHRLLASGWAPARLFGRRALATSSAVLLVVAIGDLAFVSSAPGARFHQSWPELSNFVQAVLAAIAFWAALPLDQHLAAAARSPVLNGLLRPFLILGAMSYSLYLLHAQLYQIPFAFVRQVVPNAHPLSPLLTIFGTVVLAYVFYLGCERPFLRRYWEERARRPQAASPAVDPGVRS
jgi:peptidoglycan/LPS O-acetylase OafA/YrhL